MLLIVKLRDLEIVNVREDMNKQLQEAEMILETEKQKLLKVNTPLCLRIHSLSHPSTLPSFKIRNFLEERLKP